MAERINVLGVDVSALDMTAAVDEMAVAVAQRRPSYGCTCAVYTLMQGHDRADVRSALNEADWVTPDGTPIVWALKLLGTRGVGRVYGPDLMLALSEVSARHGYPQFYFGGAAGVAQELAATMQQRFPGLPVAGTMSPGFGEPTEAEERDMIATFNRSGARVLWVGLGSPKQDLWMARFRPRLECDLLLGVGAAFDFLTGRKAQAPRWMQVGGLEWTFRLAHEPCRLWRRYAIHNPRFILKFAVQYGRHRLGAAGKRVATK